MSLVASPNSVDWKAVVGHFVQDKPVPVNRTAHEHVCPLCSTPKMYAYQDNRFAGIWHNCRHCGFAGDTIELAAAAWAITASTAVERIQTQFGVADRSGFKPQAITSYLKMVQRRQWIAEILNAGRQLRAISGESSVRRTLQNYFDFNPADIAWPERVGQLVRILERDEVVSLLPRPEEFPDGLCGVGCTIVEDLPGRAVALQLMIPNKNALLAKKPVGLYSGPIHGFACAAGLQLVAPSGPVLILDDANSVIRSQLRYLISSAALLPLAQAVGEPTPEMWQAFFPTTTPVLLFGSESIPQLRRAAQMHYDVIRSSRALHEQTATNLETIALWRQNNRISWQQMLVKLLGEMSTTDGEAQLFGLGLPTEKRDEIIQSLPDRLRREYLHLVSPKAAAKTITIRGKQLEETDEGWYCIDQQRYILNARVIPKRVLHQGDRTIYVGEILFRDKSVPFTASQTSVDKGFKWVQQTLLAAQLGPLISEKSWSTMCMAIAQSFHPPAFQVLVDRVGWDTKRSAFMFPAGTLRSNGTWEEPLIPAELNTPCQGFGPGGISSLAIGKLSLVANPTVPVFWGLTLHIVECALAGVYGVAPPCLAICGGAAELAYHRTIQYLGCQQVKRSQGVDGMLTELQSALREHDWPAAILSDSPGASSHDVADMLTGNCILAAEPAAAYALLTRPGWSVLDCNAAYLGSPAVLDTTVRRLIPAYLESLFKDHAFLANYSQDPSTAIAEHMAGWFESLGGQPVAVLAGRQLLQGHTLRAETKLAFLLRALLLAGWLQLAEVEKGPRTIIDTPEGMLLHRQGIPVALAETLLPGVDTGWVMETLTRAEALLPCPDTNYWLLRHEWWSANILKPEQVHAAHNQS